MKHPHTLLLVAWALGALAACQGGNEQAGSEGRKVETSGKEAAALDTVPAAVIDAVRAARPDLDISQAEYETRDGRQYYDVGGNLPDGSELELDMMLGESGWEVVEIQRDISLDTVPAAVGAALAAHAPDWQPDRIIESDQGDGVIVYEFFGPGEGEAQTKIEVKLEAGAAEVLADEWAH